jgi:hypothetical protein
MYRMVNLQCRDKNSDDVSLIVYRANQFNVSIFTEIAVQTL